MENTEKQMTYEESLNLIQSMIDTARNKVAEDGFHFILWGILVVISSLLNYFLLKTGHPDVSFYPWLVMPFIGLPIAIYYERRIKKQGHSKSHMDDFIKYVWTAYGFTMFFGIFCSISQNVSPIPFIMAVTGFATFVTGMTLRFKPLTAGGILFWALAVVCIFISPDDQLLIEALGISVGYLIPGFLLNKQAKSSSHVQTT